MRPARLAFTLIMLLVAVGCELGDISFPEPGRPGPFAVGVTTLELVDTSRPHPETGAPRVLITEVWYPTVQSARTQPRDYYDLQEEAPPDLQDQLARTDVPALQQPAVRDWPPNRAYGPYPVEVRLL